VEGVDFWSQVDRKLITILELVGIFMCGIYSIAEVLNHLI
jgi:hypothetical protein